MARLWRGGPTTTASATSPRPTADFVAVAAGGDHSLGLKSDGAIVAWGANDSGQCNVPAPNTDFVAVAAGLAQPGPQVRRDDRGLGGQLSMASATSPRPTRASWRLRRAGWHSLGLKSDGTIVAWGSNGYGQCDVPAPNADFVAVVGGLLHSLGLKSDGTIVAWGYNDDGQCDVPAPNAGFVAVAAGGYPQPGPQVRRDDRGLGVRTTPASATSPRPTPASWRLRRAIGTAWASSPTGRSWPGGQRLRPVQRPRAQRRLRGGRGGADIAWASRVVVP